MLSGCGCRKHIIAIGVVYVVVRFKEGYCIDIEQQEHRSTKICTRLDWNFLSDGGMNENQKYNFENFLSGEKLFKC